MAIDITIVIDRFLGCNKSGNQNGRSALLSEPSQTFPDRVQTRTDFVRTCNNTEIRNENDAFVCLVRIVYVRHHQRLCY